MSFPSSADAYIHLEGSEYNGTVIDGETILGADDKEGIRLFFVEDVTVVNCNISQVTTSVFMRGCKNIRLDSNVMSDSLYGPRLSIAASSENVTIVENDIQNMELDGILSPQRTDQDVDQPGLVIEGNKIKNVATTATNPEFYHGIYVQSKNSVIRHNLILDVNGGNGISIRAGGDVLNNYIKNTGRSSIKYFPDHEGGQDAFLNIQYNWCYNSGTLQAGAKLIEFLDIPAEFVGLDDWIIADYLVDNNLLDDPTSVELRKSVYKGDDGIFYQAFTEA